MVIIFLMFAAAAIGGCSPTTAGRDHDIIQSTPCWFKPPADWPRAECAILTVPEDYADRQSRKIELPFIIFKAFEPRKNTLPLVIAGGGGPGYPLGIAAEDMRDTENSVWTNWYHATVAAGRDLILVDNRGVGSATPRLDCIEIENAAMDLLERKLERDQLRGFIRQAYTRCKQRLLDQDIDLRHYHVINAAKDLEQLRVALSLPQLNVYGGSYGSRLALVYEKLYPNSVRALLLDGIFPQSIKTYENEPRRNYEAIMRIIDRCSRNERCQRLYGANLETRLADYLEQLDAEALKIRAINPIDDQLVDVKVTPQMFFDALYMALYDGDLINHIPRYLHAIIGGNEDYLMELISEYYIAEASVNSTDEGAYASYACYDEIPFVDFDSARSELAKYPLQHYSNELVFDHIEIMCEVWDVPAANEEFRQPYPIDTPLLIYAGELDPVTPVELARPVIENARKWWGAVWPDVSHSVMSYSECSDITAELFLADPESDPFRHPCASAAKSIIFETTDGADTSPHFSPGGVENW